MDSAENPSPRNGSDTGPAGRPRLPLTPRSVAIIGATSRPGSIGSRVTHHVLEGGFTGEIHLVNPRYSEIHGRPCHASLSDAGVSPDLCLLLVPTAGVPEELRKCASCGTKAAIVFAAGHDADDYEAWLRDIREFAEQSGVRVYGPNTVGLVLENCGLHACFAPMLEHDDWKGNGAFVTQSGGLTGPFHEAVVQSGLGMRYLIGTGSEVDATTADFIEAVLADEEVGFVVSFIEGCADAWRLADLATDARRRGVPIVLLKGGRSAKGRLASLSHTGRSSSAANIYRDVCREFGIIWVEDEVALRVALQALPITDRMPRNPGIACIASSGGICTLIADYCEDSGVRLAEFAEETREALAFLEKWGGSSRNPVDASAQLLTQPDFFDAVCDAVAGDPAVDVIVLSATARLLDQYWDQVRALARRKPVVFASVGRMPGEEMLRKLADSAIPAFASASESISGIAMVSPFAAACSTPPTGSLRRPRSNGVSRWLSPDAGMRMLARAGVPSVERCAIGSLEDAVEPGRTPGYPMVLKIDSAEVPHKAAVGGLVTGIENEEEFRNAFVRLEEVAISLRLTEFQLVAEQQLTILREVAISIFNDPEFGPLLMVARGGRDVETTTERQYGSLCLKRDAAMRFLSDGPFEKLLQGFDPGALGDCIVAACRLYERDRSLREIEINPLAVLDSSGRCAILDALIAVRDGS